MESDWSMRETGSCRLVCGGRPAHQLVVEEPRLVARTASPPQSGLFLVAQRTPEIACPPLLVGGRRRRPQQPRRVVDGDLGNLGGRRGHRRIRRHAGGQRRGRAVGGVERPSATSAARPSTRAHAPPVRFALSPSTPLGLHARRVRQARYLTTPRRARSCPGDCVHGSPHPSHQLRHSAAPPLILSVCSPGSHPFLLPPCFPSRAGSSAYTFSPLVAHPSVSPSPPPPPTMAPPCAPPPSSPSPAFATTRLRLPGAQVFAALRGSLAGHPPAATVAATATPLSARAAATAGATTTAAAAAAALPVVVMAGRATAADEEQVVRLVLDLPGRFVG